MIIKGLPLSQQFPFQAMCIIFFCHALSFDSDAWALNAESGCSRNLIRQGRGSGLIVWLIMGVVEFFISEGS